LKKLLKGGGGKKGWKGELRIQRSRSSSSSSSSGGGGGGGRQKRRKE